MRSLLVGALATFILGAGPLTAQLKEKPRESRSHHALLAKTGGEPVGTATRIVRLGKELYEEILLFRSAYGDELVIEQSTNYPKREMRIKIRDVAGEAWIGTVWKLPFAGTTAQELDKEAENFPELFNSVANDVVIETKGGSWQGSEDGWKEPKARHDLTSSLRQSLSPSLLEEIEQLSDSLFAARITGTARAGIVNYLLYRSDCMKPAPVMTIAIPDCRFDEKFGYSCSKEQQARADKLKESTTPLDATDRY